MELTKSEMEIMDVMWEAGAPMSRSDLLAHSEEKTWKDSSVHILLNGLLQKGAIQETGVVKRSKTYGRVFTPTMTREEYFATTIFCHRHKPEIVGLLRLCFAGRISPTKTFKRSRPLSDRKLNKSPAGPPWAAPFSFSLFWGKNTVTVGLYTPTIGNG